MKRLALLTVILMVAGFAILAQAPASTQADPAKPAPAAKPAEPAKAEEPEAAVPPELTGKTRFEGVIINMEGMAAGATYFSVEIEGWTGPEEITELKTILANEGQKAVLDRTWKAKPVGYLKIRNSMGKPIRYARAITVPGGYIVRLLTDTPAAHVGDRSRNYPFGFIEMMVPTEGKKKGYGSIIAMAQFSMDASGQVQISAYGNMPARLEEIEIEKPKK